MSRLSSLASTRVRANVGDIDEFNSALTSSLESASLELRKYLRTDFDQASYTDTFIPRDVIQFGQQNVLKFALSSGFLTGMPTIIYAGDFDTLTSGPTTLSSGWACDLEKGVIEIRSTLDLRGQIFQVSYTAGFTNTNGDMNGVPDWLAAAAEQTAINIMDRTVPGLRGELAKDWQDSQKAVLSSVTHKIRFFPGSEKPV